MSLRRFCIDILPVLLWLAFIFVMSTGTGGSTHTNSLVDTFLARFFPRWSHQLTWPERDAIHYYLRKAAHITEYAILGGLMLRALRRSKPKIRGLSALAWLLSTLYAATDEYHQVFVPGRTPKVTDVLLDSLGAALGIGLLLLFTRRRSAAPLAPRVNSQV